jgi:hypothetical protein
VLRILSLWRHSFYFHRQFGQSQLQEEATKDDRFILTATDTSGVNLASVMIISDLLVSLHMLKLIVHVGRRTKTIKRAGSSGPLSSGSIDVGGPGRKSIRPLGARFIQTALG